MLEGALHTVSRRVERLRQIKKLIPRRWRVRPFAKPSLSVRRNLPLRYFDCIDPRLVAKKVRTLRRRIGVKSLAFFCVLARVRQASLVHLARSQGYAQ